MMTLEDYLASCFQRGAKEHTVEVIMQQGGLITFHISPTDITIDPGRDFEVWGNSLASNRFVAG